MPFQTRAEALEERKMKRSNGSAILVISLGLCLGASPAQAAGWEDTFDVSDATSLATYIPKPATRILVARGGSAGAEIDSCASALQAALRRCSGVKLVMDDYPLGGLSKGDDQSIVRKAISMPIDLVAVVRVFPGADRGQPSGVITMYDRSARAVSALSATKGEAIPSFKKTEVVAPGQGVSAAAVASVSTVIKTTSKHLKSSETEYKRRRVWFNTTTAVNLQTGQIVGRWTIPLVGESATPLEGADFYRYVGREDLAKRYRNNTIVKYSLMIPGYALFLTGTTLGTLYFIKGSSSVSELTPDEQESQKNLGLGLLIGCGVGGLVMGMVGSFWPSHPVNAQEAIQLAEGYNQGLKKQLGLEEEEEGATVAQQGDGDAQGLSLHLLPVIAPHTYGLGLGMRF
jgi:hypothetical protein